MHRMVPAVVLALLLALSGLIVLAGDCAPAEGVHTLLPGSQCPSHMSAIPMDAFAEAYPMLVQPGATARFDGSSSWYDPDMVNYTWAITNGPVTIYRYTAVTDFTTVAVGNCTAALTVLGPYSASDTASVTVVVSTDARDNDPLARVDEISRYVAIGSMVTLSGLESFDDWGITHYEWTFDDGGPQTLVGPVCNYTFQNAGLFPLTLKVTDTVGNNGWCYPFVQVYAVDYPPVADAGPNQTVTEGTEVTLDGSASTDDNGIVEYTWSFFDTEYVVIHGVVVRHVFDHIGMYAVALTVIDDMSWEVSDILAVTVISEPPVADAGEDLVVEVGAACRFNGTGSSTSSPELSFVWNFRQGGTYEVMMGPEPTLAFREIGRYYVTLTVTDALGQSDTDVVIVTVTELARDYRLSDWLIVAGVAAAAGVATVGAMRVMKLL